MSNLKDSLSLFKQSENKRLNKDKIDNHEKTENQIKSEEEIKLVDSGEAEAGVYKIRRRAPKGIAAPASVLNESFKTPIIIDKSSSPPTEEQEQVIECDASIVKVKAFAGAGKTFTLTEYAKRRARGKGLYLAFNKDIKAEAMTKFPGHVRCMTSHGLAFPQFGSKIMHKLDGYFQWDMPYNGAGVTLRFSKNKNGNRIYSKLLQETVGSFIASDKEMIGVEHVPIKSLMMLRNNQSLAQYVPDISDIVMDAEKLWIAMADPLNDKVIANHDVYLKQMQLAAPRLPYDYILLDEAQDSNPALLDLVQRQSCIQVLVGDPHQSIYSFRKAVDAMTSVKADKTLELTTSFRFGNNIADFANALLVMKGEKSLIKGLAGEDRVYTGAPLSYQGKTAFISRVNATLIKQAAMYVSKGKKIYFAGGVESARFDLLEDIYNMYYKKGKPRDPLLASFNSYEEFKQVADEAEEVEWISRYKLVEEMGKGLMDKLSTIKNYSVDSPEKAEQIFSTVHRSKGLQFENVILADDFYKAPINKNASDRMVKDEEIEEMNIYYVGVTRAMKNLNIPKEHHDYWRDVNRIVGNDGKDMLFEPAVKGNEAYFKEAIEERRRVNYLGSGAISQEKVNNTPLFSDPFEKEKVEKKAKTKSIFSQEDPF